MASKDFEINVWKLHPKSANIIPAEKTLRGTANMDAIKFCQPYSLANQYGWWVFPPVDIDITWLGGREFDFQLLEPYSSVDHDLVVSLINPRDGVEADIEKWCPAATGRSKFTWGAVEDGVVQMWTGCIFETPPGVCLQIRSPINCPRRPFFVMEGILETDWMQYDIWMNLVFDKENELVKFRKNEWPPVAQLIPVRRDLIEKDWQKTDSLVNRDTPEANRVFEYWIQYNQKKFASGGKQILLYPDVKKDSTTFHKEKLKMLDKATLEPKIEQICPRHLKPQTKLKSKYIKRKKDG